MDPKEGDLLWLSRHPGGWCLFLTQDLVSADVDLRYTKYTVIHPTEGVMTDADWYFKPMKENEE